MKAKDIDEVITLQSEFMRKQLGTVTEQFKRMTGGTLSAAKDVSSRSRCGGLKSSLEPVVGGSGATKTRHGLLQRSLRVVTRSVPWLDVKGCRRGNCLAGAAN